MHNTIYEYKLNVVEKQRLFLPLGSKILSVKVQRGNICLCAMIDTTAKVEERVISIVGTGNPLPKINPDQSFVHIDTIQQYGLVWHVFEIVQKDMDDLKGVRFGQ